MTTRSSPQVRGNLPAETAHIVGRRREVSEARRLLAGARLLTFTGIGGVGKTRLALRVAGAEPRAFPDGVWLVELAPLQDENLLARTVARVLGLRDQSARPSVEKLADYLTDKRLLLVLDNCEHLLNPVAGFVDTILDAAPHLRVLATSREPLHAEHEVVFEVPPLTLPRGDGSVSLGEVIQCEAAALLEERARAVVPSFSVDESNYRIIARMCRHLEGIPLAIELAAVRLRMLTPGELIERLDDRFRLLTGGLRTALPRQQTLRATIDWSFGLCSPRERLMWARLSVFSGGFDLDAAEHVCAGDGIASDDVQGLLAALIDKSVLATDGDGPRYRMLEMLRQYGHERLTAIGVEPLRRRHRDYYRHRAELAGAGWFGPRQGEWFAALARDLANFRVALQFCLAVPGEAEKGLAIAHALHGYWIFNGSFGEARHWFDEVLKCEQSAGPVRFKALALSATFALMQGEVAIAMPLVDECREYARGTPNAVVVFLLGRIALLSGNYGEAVHRLRTSLDWHHRFGGAGTTPGEVFLISFYLAIAAAFLGDRDAGDLAASCLRFAESADAGGELSMGLWIRGIERWRAGDHRRAAALFRDSLRLDRALGYRYSPAWSIEAMAWTEAAQGRCERAARLLAIAEGLRKLMGLSLSGFQAYRDAHEDCDRRVRRTLGDREYADVFRWASELGIDAAIANALGEDGADDGPPGFPLSRLTARERQVGELVARGFSNKQIAAELVISQRTAEGHVENMLTKLGLTSRAQLARCINESG